MCHAASDADADANSDANRIRTKNNMPPSPSMGDIMTPLGAGVKISGQWEPV